MLAAGLATPLAVAAIVGVMVKAAFAAHRGKGPWYFNGGWEYDLTLLAVAAALGFAGPGTASLDPCSISGPVRPPGAPPRWPLAWPPAPPS